MQNAKIKRFDFIDSSNYIVCNYDDSVERFIVNDKKYLFEFPDSNRFVSTVCAFKAIRACDMKIISTYVNGTEVPEDDEYTFSYVYADLDKINFTSFSYKERCIIYMSLN